MNTNEQQLKSYLTIFSITAIVPIVFFAVLGFILQPVSGDMTRLGRFSERDFGWNLPQPVLSPLPSIPAGKPDIVVLGDSFSQPNIWQTIVTNKTNLTLLTFSHLAMRNPECIEHWLKSMPERYPSAKIIIIQSTEKSFWLRFTANPLNCKNRIFSPYNNPMKSTVETRPMGYPDIMPDPVYAIGAMFKLRKNFDTSTRNSNTIIEPLNRSDLFSSRRSDLLLYFRGDVNQLGITPQKVQIAMANIAAFQEFATSKGVQLIINVVPDKSSVYTRFFKTPNPELVVPNAQKEMAERGLKSIDLWTPFNEQVEKTKDLYLPNDSHLSTRGYILMGEVIADALTTKARSSIQ
jgi:SGNH hydrolase-like domain, acetyltransferase AlgX